MIQAVTSLCPDVVHVELTTRHDTAAADDDVILIDELKSLITHWSCGLLKIQILFKQSQNFILLLLL